MATKKATCSIVIRCYNEGQHIGRLLAGILQQSIRDVEIILVDSGSTDATLSIASKYPVRILYIKPEEFSFGRSLNLGCQVAGSEFVVIASAHVYPVYEDWLEKLLAPFTDPKVALVYGKQRGDNSTRYSERQIFSKWFPEQSVSRQDHPFCNNANAVIRKEVWEELYYNERLTGLEDLDWAKRAMEKGYYITYAAEAEIIHVHNEAPLRIYNRYLREGMAHRQIFPEQKFTLWDFVKMFTGNVVADYYQAWHDRMLRGNLLSIPLFRLMQFWGTYRGFVQSGLITNKLKERFYYPNNIRRSQLETVKDSRKERRIDYSELEKENPDAEDY
ncbi:glycosyltransferase family 2 protein [Dehalococcoidia bacterium]|nr:glycosyltransferase family 2 protein [Dehalococcoidia bacterium]